LTDWKLTAWALPFRAAISLKLKSSLPLSMGQADAMKLQ
jgi:hypothetical protein